MKLPDPLELPMRDLLIATVVAITTLTPAAAQTVFARSNGTTRNGQVLVNRSQGMMNQPNVGEGPVSCLKRKTTGNLECHSFKEWQRIAYRLEKKQRKQGR
ncbi:hypothetical protein SAMN05216382_2319 [Sphingomonas palmae]|uniref:Uncharacterized protein n=1 Tax=Sphingomonas palmae TaxID=1855283 RepID=A0A1H7RRA2_9SPHN|nr:hypothetical protein [Sphingomonas palmae]SEL62354.1 hypothetical protein SAMN05216382_2319 [Sphingomonas palmae]